MKKIISTLAILALTLGVNAQKTTTKAGGAVKKEVEQPQKRSEQISPTERSTEHKVEETEHDIKKTGQVEPIERQEENQVKEFAGSSVKPPPPIKPIEIESEHVGEEHDHKSKEDKRIHAEEKSNGHAYSGKGKGGDKNLVDPEDNVKKDKKDKKQKKNK